MDNSYRYRVLYILHSSSKYEGSSRSFLIMLNGLIEKGIFPFVIIPSYGDICEELKKRNVFYLIRKYYLSVYPSHKSINNIITFPVKLGIITAYNYLAIRKIHKIIKDYEINIVHTNVGPLYVGWNISKKLKIPHVWHIREYIYNDFGFIPLYSMGRYKKLIKSEGNYPIAISKGLFEYFELNDRGFLVYNGFEKNQNNPSSFECEKYFLYVGRIEDGKGLSELLKVFSKFSENNNDYLLYVVGTYSNTSYKKIIENIISINKLKNRVILLGKRDDVNDLMSKATAMIMSSKCEAFGRVTVEAMLNNCLVIGKNNGGTKEILENNKYGLLYDNDSDLLSLLENVVRDDRNKYNKIIEAAKNHAIEMFSAEKYINSIYNIYNNIISKYGK